MSFVSPYLGKSLIGIVLYGFTKIDIANSACHRNNTVYLQLTFWGVWIVGARSLYKYVSKFGNTFAIETVVSTANWTVYNLSYSSTIKTPLLCLCARDVRARFNNNMKRMSFFIRYLSNTKFWQFLEQSNKKWNNLLSLEFRNSFRFFLWETSRSSAKDVGGFSLGSVSIWHFAHVRQRK